MTNVLPSDLNYDKYASDQYDRDIVNSIPYHKELHEHITRFIISHFNPLKNYSLLDLGTGTGITAKFIQDLMPNAKIDAVDFSKQMLSGARKKLGNTNIRYILGDYTEMRFDRQYDVVISVIGMHHQTDEGKRLMFKKIHSLLKQDGVFIFGDLVTYTEPHLAALNTALHYHHLVEHAADEKTLIEWAHHHIFLNNLASLEDQIEWLRAAGFTVKKEFQKINTALLLCSQ